MNEPTDAANDTSYRQLHSVPLELELDPEVRVHQFMRAVADAGLTLRHNPLTGRLHLGRAQSRDAGHVARR